MVEALPAGTMIPLRVTRRFAHYNVGELIAEPPGPALELVTKRLAVTVGIQLVPQPREETGSEAPPAAPVRQPGQIVRK